MKNSLLQKNRNFWSRHPALGCSITALLGIMNFWLGVIWVLFRIFLSPKKGWMHLLIFTLFWCYVHSVTSSLPETTEGRFLFSTHSVQRTSSPFQKGWLYKGTISGSIPCSISYYKKEKRPKANCDFFITGVLQKREPFNYTLKATKWEPVPNSWSLAEFRLSIREKLRSLLEKNLDSGCSSFLIALLTGEKESRTLTYEFSRLGVQHILAVSGFHFAMIIAFTTFAFRQFMSSKVRIWSLLLIGLLYFLFVGDSPPVFRSFCTLSFLLIGKILNRPSLGLNLLGATLLIELLLNPLVCYTIGFQLSFASCLGILLLHNPLECILEPLLPSRSFSELKELSILSQCAAILVALFKKSLIIMLAVNLALWPLLLFHFQQFPLLSLIYNLFVPEMAALSLFFLLGSLSLHLVAPILGVPLFKITNFIVKNLLELVAHPPFLLDYKLYVSISSLFVTIYLSALMFFGVHLYRRDLDFG